MQKNILILYYTQTGQLEEIIRNFIKPLQADGHNLELVRIYPEKEYEFPWSADAFFWEFPNSMNLRPTPLKPWRTAHDKYDLIILGWQAWFLSPGVPVTSIVKSDEFKQLAAGTPLVLLGGMRNMWINAYAKLKPLLQDSGAKTVGNTMLCDQHGNWVSGVTILYWLLGGKKDRLWGIFPEPGVARQDIAHADKLGEVMLPFLRTGNYEGLQQAFVNKGGVFLRWDLMLVERVAGKLFKIWAGIINSKSNKKAWLVGFKYYLLFALFIVAPIVTTLNGLFVRPFTLKKIEQRKRLLEKV